MNGPCPTCYGTFTYDPRGNLQEAYTLVSGQWVTQDYSYDAFGRRYGTTVTTTNGTTPISYALDGWNVLLGYNGSSFIGSLLGLGLDECYLENFDGTSTSSILKDALGSVVGLTNSSQALTDTYRYDPYGATTHATSTSINGLLFAGQADDNNNLYFMRHRYYLPAIGRFISRDPIGLSGGLNMYAYAADDPTNVVDSEGLVGWGTIIGGSVETGIGAVSSGESRSTAQGYFTTGGNGSVHSSGSFGLAPPNGQALSPSSPGSTASAFGGYAGVGAGVFLTNADTVTQLSGPFRTYSFSVGSGTLGVSFQFSIGQDATGETIWEFAFMPVGVGYGASASAYNTDSTTWSGWAGNPNLAINATPGPGNIGAGSGAAGITGGNIPGIDVGVYE